MRITIAILAYLFCLQFSRAQKIEPKFTFNVELGLPVAISNKPFQDIMQGLACGSIYGQYSLPFHLNFGLGARYTLFTVNEFSLPASSPVSGQIHTAGGFVKIGWDKFHNNRFATDFGVKVGYSMNFVTTDANEDLGVGTVQMDAILIEPTLGLILTADEKNSYRLNIGYCIQGYGFSPYRIGLQSDAGYDAAEFNKLTQYLVVGFGYTYYFRDKTN